MKKLIPLWFILIVIFVFGIVYRNKITNRLGRFKLVHAPRGYTGILQDPIDLHLKEATCWNKHTGAELPSDNLSHPKNIVWGGPATQEKEEFGNGKLPQHCCHRCYKGMGGHGVLCQQIDFQEACRRQTPESLRKLVLDASCLWRGRLGR